MVKQAFPNVKYSENSFVKVKGNKSPFDGDLNYWTKRNSVFYEGHTAKAPRKQSYSCGHCGLKFLESEKVELKMLRTVLRGGEIREAQTLPDRGAEA